MAASCGTQDTAPSATTSRFPYSELLQWKKCHVIGGEKNFVTTKVNRVNFWLSDRHFQVMIYWRNSRLLLLSGRECWELNYKQWLLFLLNIWYFFRHTVVKLSLNLSSFNKQHAWKLRMIHCNVKTTYFKYLMSYILFLTVAKQLKKWRSKFTCKEFNSSENKLEVKHDLWID